MKTGELIFLFGVGTLWAWSGVHAESVAVPLTTIYPGERIEASRLRDEDIAASRNEGLPREAIVGKMARRTLLPGKPIGADAIGEARLVRSGSPVRIVFEKGSLMIVTRGVALQSGGAGDLVPVRNIQSGRMLQGLVSDQDTVRIGPP